ncbi:uncharacterized protein N7484_006807 [Penicillium longicatenatum]|uniref:uncharacterized protein n=1 Tax=Penicillium longicatenatum TaxID=1561947 RepID=UPI002548CE3E|nr:uncharacterized protein N7484_006807 [Penicillium longicatenatum]KAJ5638945.1 hypothetical protein N7484_006807 [Penicillium longicatenatum]
MFLIAIIFMSYLAPYVAASKGAGPYQTMYMWYAYRMDIEAFGARPEMIAPNCFGSVPDGTCYLDEFIKHLQRDGHELPEGQDTTAGKYFYPDAVDMADEIGKLQVSDGKGGTKDFIPNQDPEKILPGAFTEPNPRIADVMSKITDKMQAARRHLGDDAVKDGLAEARNAIQGAHEGRLAENGQEFIDEVNDYLHNEKNWSGSVDVKNPTAIDGSTYLDIDIDLTKSKDPQFSSYWDDFQTWLMQQKRTKKTKSGRVRMHFEAAAGTQQISARAFGGNDC